jgi:nucleotide-binding universal stress UspA family protein
VKPGEKEVRGWKKILWAVDAFPDSPDLQAQTGRAIRRINEGFDAMVEPVYVVRSDPFWSMARQVPSEREGISRRAKRNLAQWVDKYVTVPHLSSPRILGENPMSRAAAVKSLVRYAADNKFDLIAVGTHARKAVPRLFLGSFAESLILQCPLPVLVANSRSPLRDRVKTILFATDFSAPSRQAFERVVGLAKAWNARILLWHQVEYLYPQTAYPFVVPPVTPESLEEIREEARLKAEGWIRLAEKAGVRAKLHLSVANLDVADAIARAAKRLDSAIIALVSQTGPVGQFLMGSVTRRLVRAADSPVLVLPPPGRARPAARPVRIAEARAGGRALLS